MSLAQVTNTGVHTRDGFGPVQLGGAVNARFGTLDYTDTTAKRLFRLPKGAEIVGWMVNIPTAFDASTGNVLDLGDGTTANRFANDLALGTAGQVVTGFDPAEMATPLAADTDVYATYVPTGDAATEGAAQVICLFVMR
ncbi:MAG TPA: hypothetical protein PKD09_10615 [Aggregatilinea sp.]|uniref:hypothetical protein n=1 Tax=Aggregatilinea sp. TaxID=2806333 RepID=UPI002BCCABBF|nr:hypothetical protein [Aggregatilinea sp.]HML22095.1 hypothetical protein [Aggregatilinea sp.]